MSGAALRRSFKRTAARKAEAVEAPEVEQAKDVDPYEGLTDEELLDAYLTNVSDDADELPETRDEFIAALSELDAE